MQQYVGELPTPPVTLDVWWAPDTEHEDELYEDAGDGLSYREGEYLLHRFTYASAAREFTLRRQVEGHLETARTAFELALHALPHVATPTLVVDGREVRGEFDARHIFRAAVPADFAELQLRF